MSVFQGIPGFLALPAAAIFGEAPGIIAMWLFFAIRGYLAADIWNNRHGVQ